MKSLRISRRALLRGIGGVAISLPLLDIMEPRGRARAQSAGGPPKRFIVMFEQSGTIYNSWKPTGGTTDFTLSEILTPLEAHRQKLVIVDGLSNKAGSSQPGDDHQKGICSCLTATEMAGGSGGGISLDQEIAGKLGAGSKFASLEFGVQVLGSGPTYHMSFAGAGKPLPAVDDPAAMFTRVFGSFVAPAGGGTTTPTGPDPAIVRLLAERQSVLDAVKDSYTSLLPSVSTEDKVKLEAHLAAIRDIEKRLVSTPADTGSSVVTLGCEPGTSQTIAYRTNDNFPAVGKLQLDMLAQAIACDQTRVATIQFSRESADPVFTWLGQNRGHHSISHDSDGNATSVQQLIAINKWHAEQFAYLLAKLDSMQEGSGTVLDNSLVLWVNGLAKGNVHSHSPQPIVLAGGAGGKIATGRFLSFPNTNTTNEFYVACLNALDIPATSFGNAAYAKGPLAGLVS
jgi:hypothetical protein